MEERQIREPGGGYSPYPVLPLPRRGNTLRALSVLLGVALLAGFVLYGLQQIEEAIASGNANAVQEQINPSPKEQTVIIQKGEKVLPYPKTRAQVADRFGGTPRDWSQNLFGGWVYASDTSIVFPIGRNVTLYTDHLTLYWQEEIGE